MRPMWMAAPGPFGVMHSPPAAVLIAENTEVGSALATALRKKGWRVMLCHSGMHALDLIRTQSWDALVIGLHSSRVKRPAMAVRTLLLTTDAVGVEVATAATCASHPAGAPTDEIVSRITRLIQDATAS
jgi:hypothetical protein